MRRQQGRNGTNVRMGQLAVASSDAVLYTLLGSCVGLALYDKIKKIGGLAHVVLPESRGKVDNPGKYADTAIPTLIAQMEDAGARIGRLTAKVAGGANMFAVNDTATIGVQNLSAIEDALAELGIPIVGRHCGGESGRRMTLQLDSGRVVIEQVGCDEQNEI